MHIALINVHVKPESVEAFKQVSLDNARSSLNEPGVARFDVLQQKNDPTRFVLYEVYRTPDDPAKHRETDHYKTWSEAVESMMAEPRSRAFFANVFPVDGAWG